MTQKEISKYLDIPLTTLNDWKKEDSNRYKLYQLLINLDTGHVENLSIKKTNHRIFHILNRNIDNSLKFSYNEIKEAFSKNNYYKATKREQTIYSKFFKELNENELDEFVQTFDVSKRNIKSIYISSPFRSLKGVAKIWDRRFRVKHLSTNTHDTKKIPSALQNIINRKTLAHV
ncbi:MAG: hypothetical protein WA916_08705 [Arcobacter sp.]|uniref:hypothetical protein n=1 Tax=Arcobacter sp. TaxID=1872629 RepID=UPI003C756F05